MNINFAIWSSEHLGYWKPNRTGYTRNPHEAGLYRLDESLEICDGAAFSDNLEAPPESMVPEMAMTTLRQTWDFRHGGDLHEIDDTKLSSLINDQASSIDADDILEPGRMLTNNESKALHDDVMNRGLLVKDAALYIEACEQCGGSGCSSCNGVSIP